MEEIDLVLQQWRSLQPHGAVFRADGLDEAIAMVGNLIAESGAQRCSQRRALQLLRVDDDVQVPLLVQMLRVDDDFTFQPKAEASKLGVVYFPCFWQAMHELQKRLTSDQAAEPMAEELHSFRDAALDLAAKQQLTTASFADLLIAFRDSSLDPEAFNSLLESVRFLVRETRSKTNDSATLQHLVVAQKALPMSSFAAILLPWLCELCEDYCRGERAGLLRGVRDVLGCSKQEACELLGKGQWDLEAALRQHHLQNQCNTLDAMEASRPDRFSSQALKILRAERECPICACDFRVGAEPIVTSCCFKSICAHCVAVLVARVEDGLLHCPFCRQTGDVPMVGEGQEVAEESQAIFEAAHRWVASAGTMAFALLGEVRSLFQDEAAWTARRSNNVDVRLNVVLPLQ